MKTYLDCIPRFFKQGLSAARIAVLDSKEQKEVLDEIARIIPNIPLNSSPPEIAPCLSGRICKVLRKCAGVLLLLVENTI